MESNEKKDIILIGAGIMSATLGFFLKELIPNSNIRIYERCAKTATESSHSWNNAGTGHNAFCEMNYTPEQKDGSINIDKALEVAERYESSKQFWSYLLTQGYIKENNSFINSVPHMSFVWGEKNISFLKNRYDTLIKHPLFEDMEYSEDHDEIAKWVPLVMRDRNKDEKIAATKMDIGTDVSFDAVTNGILDHFENLENINVFTSHQVKGIKKQDDGRWKLRIKDVKNGNTITDIAEFVFVGGGGGALPLLQKSGIKEGKGYGGFPVSGKFFRCTDEEVIKDHLAKVYGKAAEGSPPMSMPHLDARFINGEKSLLFGPYAGLSSRFLKNGSSMDLFKSIRLNNLGSMIGVGLKNFYLIRYLASQASQSKKKRFKTLKDYYPKANINDWQLYTAGQRVQIIKKEEGKGAVLKLGTEIIQNEEKTLAVLLGASPGASVSVSSMLKVIENCYPEEMKTESWKAKIREMIPSYGQSLIKDGELCKKVRKETAEVLGL